ncbi:retrovirus-related pol polyprotein from transposon RE2 [Tanacetum coccineum]
MTSDKGDKGDTSQKGHGSYLLMTGDNPGNLITHVQLKGVNYKEWAMAMRTAFRAKKKIGFIDGTIKEPATGSADVEDWWMINSMIVSWIFNTIEPTLRSQISYVELAKDLWDDLKQRSYGTNSQTMKDSPCASVLVASVTSQKEFMKRQEEERVHQFMMGLEEETYRMAYSNVLVIDPLTNVSQVYSIMMREEQLRNISRDRDVRSDAIAFVARQNSKRGHTSDKEKALCGNCGKHGHETNGCFDIIGYPEWYIEKYGSDKTCGKGNIDRVTRTMIGTDKEQGGVFLFKEAEQGYENWVKVDDDFELWHRRLGHPSENKKKGWIVYDIENDEYFISRDVVFHKLIFPYSDTKNQTFGISQHHDNDLFGSSSIQEGCFHDVSPDVAFVSVDNVGNENAQSLESDSFETHDLSKNDIGESVAEPPILSNTSGGNVGSVDPTENHEQMNDSRMQEHEYGCGKQTRQPSAFLALVTSSSESTRYSQAVKEKNWCDAMKAEIDALESNGTWELVTLPPRKKAIGIDYKETFAQIAKLVTVRTFLSVAAVKNWELHQMDVHNAFLHGDLNEDVYMRLHPGFVARDKIKEFKAYFSECFHMKDLGSLQYFLGLKIAQSKEGIYLCQRKYALDIIAESGLLGYKPASFPMDENHNIALATGPLLKEPEKYRRLVGRLIYLTISRPVHILAKFMKTPLEVHWEAALRVVKYLKGNLGQGVLLSSNSKLFVSAYGDSDWAGVH